MQTPPKFAIQFDSNDPWGSNWMQPESISQVLDATVDQWRTCGESEGDGVVSWAEIETLPNRRVFHMREDGRWIDVQVAFFW